MIDLTTLLKITPTRDPDFIIGGADHPYLLRWYLIPRNEAFNVYYHRFVRDDDDRALHDHPWPSFSLMLKGQVREHTKEGTQIIRAGEGVYRGADYAHRIELIDGEPCETLFITGPKVRDWGFHCPKGWVHWEDFVAPDDTGNIGRGCGEMA